MVKRDFTKTPDSYYRPIENCGTMTRISYKSCSYDEKNIVIDQDALVYLPYGYDSENRDYNVFYLMHGGGGDSNEIFGGIDAVCPIKKILDNMIANGDIEPIIVVAPSFYYQGTDSALRSTVDARLLTQNFHHEFVRDLIPAVEASFRARSGRDHRAFGGFSMGSEATWNIFAKCLGEVRYFIPMSGDCWAIELQGGMKRPIETVEYLTDCINRSGVGLDGFCVYAATGDHDIAYRPMNSMFEEMSRHADIFRFGRDFSEGTNIVYTLAADGIHTYDYCNHYVYDALKLFFGK